MHNKAANAVLASTSRNGHEDEKKTLAMERPNRIGNTMIGTLMERPLAKRSAKYIPRNHS
jgi:hypothetical protein